MFEDDPHLTLGNRTTSTLFLYLCDVFFQPPGLTMWRVNSGGLVSARGSSVRRLWRGLPPDLPRLTAVLERHSDHAIIFISGIIHNL